MNRAQRREVVRAKPVPPPRRRYTGPNRPSLVEVHRCFAPIDHMLDCLDAGEIYVIDDVVVFKDFEDSTWYALVPAMLGWCELWQRLALHYRLDIDTGPVRVLMGKLERAEYLAKEEIAAGRAVVDLTRRAYMGMDVYEVKSFVRTQQLKIQLEDAGLARKEEQ
ncbi:hypothetical protein [Aquitalea aquatilis]|uniref:hypothetical protein n=1 Tax=Aquitalea aquatilis TaxID=1537400 RepID=UPI0010BD557E|nr:hypothetical protein [Aquitalea aquatilis]